MTKTIAYCTLIFPVKFDIFLHYRTYAEIFNAGVRWLKSGKLIRSLKEQTFEEVEFSD